MHFLIYNQTCELIILVIYSCPSPSPAVFRGIQNHGYIVRPAFLFMFALCTLHLEHRFSQEMPCSHAFSPLKGDRVPPMPRPPVRQQPRERAGCPLSSSAGARGQLGAAGPRVPNITQKDDSTCRQAAWLAGNSAPCSPQCSKMLVFSTQCIPLNIQGRS